MNERDSVEDEGEEVLRLRTHRLKNQIRSDQFFGQRLIN